MINIKSQNRPACLDDRVAEITDMATELLDGDVIANFTAGIRISNG